MDLDPYKQRNLANWNDRVPIHTGPDGYGVHAFAESPTLLSDVVDFDKDYLGDVTGLSLVHPQCHIGTDTLSWATVTGIDFSAPALEAARGLADRLAINASFIESELYAVPSLVTEQFDIVYTGVGAINWLPDITGWAEVMVGLTKPGGRFYMREGHPVLWALDHEREDDLLVINEPYFETIVPGTWDVPSTYVGSGTLSNTTTHEWNHGLGEVINALIQAGLRIALVEEHRSLEWDAGLNMVKRGPRWEMPTELRDRVPLMYSIVASKPAGQPEPTVPPTIRT